MLAISAIQRFIRVGSDGTQLFDSTNNNLFMAGPSGAAAGYKFLGET
jgi:hypothetical protein